METQYSNPTVPLISNPINLDKEIQYIQETLALLPWLHKSFGRARTGKDDKGKTFPEVYKGHGDYHNVLINDHLKSQSFMRVKGDTTGRTYPTDKNVRTTQQVQCPLDIIFWYDLKKIDPGKNYRFDEELKKDVTDLLKGLPAVKILKIYEAYEDVFQGYSLEFMNPNMFRYPFGGFRFECQLDYTEGC
jgi:hypothetical protein